MPRSKGRYTKSCGCKKSELTSDKNRVHGMSGTKFYKHWRSMFDRGLPSYVDKSSYVGVCVAERWKKFEFFYEDMYESWERHEAACGGRDTTLDRIDVRMGYSKDNCRWATQAEQSVNKKNTVYITCNEKTKPLKIWCTEKGKKYDRVYYLNRAHGEQAACQELGIEVR